MKESKNIRSEYIKNLVEDKEELSKTLSETAKSAISDILESEVKKGFRQILTEANDDDFEVEDVDVKENPADDATEVDAEEGASADADTAADADNEAGADDAEVETGEDAEDSVDGETDDEIWGELEQYKDDEGEYDLTKLDKESAVKVLKVMNPESDGIRVMKNPNGSIKLSDDNTETEYIIDVDGSIDSEEPEEDGELEFDIDLTESADANLGYTDDYQKKTAMTTPDNHEPANPKYTYSMDGGAPTGTEKPWVGKKRGDAPFSKVAKTDYPSRKVNEGEMEECGPEGCGKGEEPVVEVMTSTENSAAARGTSMTHANTNNKQKFARNGHVQSKETRGTGEGYQPANEQVDESIVKVKKMANQIFRENKELKKLAGEFKNKLEESVVINSSLANVIKLLTENSTTRDEKVSIIQRFDKVKTVDESKNLYESISRELKSTKNFTVPTNEIPVQMNESKATKEQILNENALYQCDDLQGMIGLIERMNKI